MPLPLMVLVVVLGVTVLVGVAACAIDARVGRQQPRPRTGATNRP
jgi:hypothetical protein